jgi:Domain of unknown function (DUF3472)/Domain of unknown function (DUF5077)
MARSGSIYLILSDPAGCESMLWTIIVVPNLKSLQERSMFRRQLFGNWSASVVVMSTLLIGGGLELSAKEWSVPLAGNAFPTSPVDDDRLIGRSGQLSLSSPADAFSIYVRVDRVAKLALTLKGPANQDATGIAGRVGETMLQPFAANGGIALGEISVPKAGYVKLEIWGAKESHSPVRVTELMVASETEDLQLDFVRDNEGNMYYWGRRGPSVHLRYEVPKERPVRYAYSEITVPVGQDPIGSYFMANGFGEGYFGFQVNSAKERRVLFSVWSPFHTDNPRDIPKDHQIVALGRGPDVHIGEFGNEGSGGQSYLRYPWQAGKTYRFLTEVKPDGEGQTVYTSWFGDQAADEWRLIASFQRPKTDTNLTGFHSFLESFAPTFGHVARRACYGNVGKRRRPAMARVYAGSLLC